MDPPWIHAILFFFAPVNDIMHSESEIKCLQPYGEEEPLRGTRPEELLPLVGVARREGDWVDGELELCRDGARPLGELGGRGRRRNTGVTEDICGHLPKQSKRKSIKSSNSLKWDHFLEAIYVL